MRPSLAGLTAAVLIALSSGACVTMTVSSHVERGLDFRQFQSYDWGLPDALPTADPRLDSSVVFRDRLQGAIEKALAAKGLRRVSGGSADLLVHVHASASRRIDVDRIDRGYGYRDEMALFTRVTEYEAATVILDIVDAKTSRIIWRGWVQDNIENLLSEGDRGVREVNEAVTRMLARFPRPL